MIHEVPRETKFRLVPFTLSNTAAMLKVVWTKDVLNLSVYVKFLMQSWITLFYSSPKHRLLHAIAACNVINTGSQTPNSITNMIIWTTATLVKITTIVYHFFFARKFTNVGHRATVVHVLAAKPTDTHCLIVLTSHDIPLDFITSLILAQVMPPFLTAITMILKMMTLRWCHFLPRAWHTLLPQMRTSQMMLSSPGYVINVMLLIVYLPSSSKNLASFVPQFSSYKIRFLNLLIWCPISCGTLSTEYWCPYTILLKTIFEKPTESHGNDRSWTATKRSLFASQPVWPLCAAQHAARI